MTVVDADSFVSEGDYGTKTKNKSMIHLHQEFLSAMIS